MRFHRLSMMLARQQEHFLNFSSSFAFPWLLWSFVCLRPSFVLCIFFFCSPFAPRRLSPTMKFVNHWTKPHQKKLDFECIPPDIQRQRMHFVELNEDNFYPKRTILSSTWKLEIEKGYATPKKPIALYISFIFIIDSCILHRGMHHS